MKIPEQVIDKINNRISIIDIASKYISLEKSGSRYRACCPFHQEKTPSFYLTPEKNLYYCFGCHKGGTVFNFLMDIENLSFPEAVKILAEKAGVEISGYDPGESSETDALKELYKRLADTFCFFLKEKKEGRKGLAYLEKRGIINSTIEEFKLGFAPADRNWLHKFLAQKKYSSDFLKRSGLFSQRYPKICLFSDRIIFPILSARGEVIAFGGRAFADSMPKYLNSPELPFFKKRENLYGFFQARQYIRQTGTFYLVEGYMDVLAMHQAGIKNAVAPLGTAFTEDQAKTLKRFADNAALMFDGDKAGRNAAKKSIYICEHFNIKSSVAEFNEGEDPAEILQKKGPLAIKEKKIINSFKYLVKNAQIDNNTSSPEGKLSILTDLFSYIDSIPTETRKEVYLRELSELIGVEFNSILGDYEKHKKGGISGYKSKQRTAPSEDNSLKRVSIDLFLMISLAANFNFFDIVRNNITIEDLEEKYSKELYIIFEDCFRNGVFTIDSLLQNITNPSLKSLVLEKIASEEFNSNQEELINDTIVQIKMRSLNKKKNSFETMLRSKDYSSHSETELLEDLMYINGELLKLKVRNHG